MYDFDRLINFARIIRYNLQQLEVVLNKPVKFHIAFYRRPMVGFLIGTMFRTSDLVIYQNNDAKNRFEKVANIQDRKYKEKVNQFIKYTIDNNIQNPEDENILLVINSASHNVNVNEESLKKFSNVITITLNSNGTIPYKDDWTDYSQEIYNIFNEVQTTYKTIRVAHSMPEALAILLGMGLENYWNVEITQYSNGSYPVIYRMNQIKYYF